MTSQPNTQGYEEYYVAFIDLLGFRDIVKRSEEDPELFRGIVELLSSIKSSKSSPSLQDKHNHFYVHSFSDSIILFANHDDYWLGWLLYKVSQFCAELLMLNIATRGSIVKGNLYYDGSILFGGGVNEAYDLESKHAKYPRILVHDDVRECIENTKGNGLPLEFVNAYWHWESHPFRCDTDGYYYLNYLSICPACVPRGGREFLEKTRAFIISQLDNNKNMNEKVFEKYRWLAEYFNAVIKSQCSANLPAVKSIEIG